MIKVNAYLQYESCIFVTNLDPLCLHLVDIELSGDVEPLGEETKVGVPLVHVHPHTQRTKQLTPLLQQG